MKHEYNNYNVKNIVTFTNGDKVQYDRYIKHFYSVNQGGYAKAKEKVLMNFQELRKLELVFRNCKLCNKDNFFQFESYVRMSIMGYRNT
jgi:hypothetical protein